MKKLLKPFFFGALALALLSDGVMDAWAQSGPAGLNPGNFVTSTNTAADTASLAASIGDANHFAFLCGLVVSGTGATAATTVNVTVGPFMQTGGTTTNIIAAYTFASGATAGSAPLIMNFTPCLPGPIGTIGVTVPGAAGNTSTNISMWGYKQ